MTFRARLMLLLISFLLLTIFLVIALDNWAQKRTSEEVDRQSMEVKSEVQSGFGDFMQAVGMAIQNLSSTVPLYERIEAGEVELPPTVQHIIVADKQGIVTDTTYADKLGHPIAVPSEQVTQARLGDPVEGEVEIHGGGQLKTYSIPFEAVKGTYWIIIVTREEFITNKIDDASKALAGRSRELSNIRLATTAGVLVLALGIVVFIGWRFTHPIKQLASAARRVAAGKLDFRVRVDRQDEVGQLANTFNEMMDGLNAKRELEEKLNHAEREAVIGRLTQSVAHEIRNPLNVINLSIDHVSSRYAPEDETRRARFTQILSSIKDELARLKHLVNDLLNYGRPSQLAVQEVDLRELVRETLSLVRPQADEQGVEISLDLDGAPARVQADRERLKSCLSNIAINALQAMPAGGHLWAEVRQTDGFIEVAIKDSGVGISRDHQDKIFEPYFSTKQTGFGLGLAVTKKIVDEHQGKITVESEIDRGTTFKVRLPRSER